MQLARVPGCMDGDRSSYHDKQDILDTVLYRSFRSVRIRAQHREHVFYTGGIASGNDAYVQLLGTDISGLTVGSFVMGNLLPVTLGNLVGGGIFVGVVYWLIGRKLK